MFESGAISSTLESARVCPVIFNMDETDLQGPLAQFQVTRFVKDDIRHLFETVNGAAGDEKLSPAVLESVFNKWWPDLENDIGQILAHHGEKKKVKGEVRSDRELIEEILLLMRTRAQDDKAPRALGPPPKYNGSIYELLMHACGHIIKAALTGTRAQRVSNIANILTDVEKALAPRNLTALIKGPLIRELHQEIQALQPQEMDDEIPF